MLQARIGLLQKFPRRARRASSGNRKAPQGFYRSELRMSPGAEGGTLAARLYGIYDRELGKYCRKLSDGEWDELLAHLGKGCDREVRDRAVIHVLKYAARVAKQYAGMSSLSILDLIQEAAWGLFDAAETFELSKALDGTRKFVAWADPWIRANILLAITQYGGAVTRKSPDQFVYKIRKFVQLFHQRFHRDPDTEDVAEGLRILKKRVVSAEEHMHFREDHSLDRAPQREDDGEESYTLRYRFPDRSELSPEAYVLAKEELRLACGRVKKIFESRTWNSLQPRDQLIFILRYGLNGATDRMTYVDIAERFSLTRQRVDQVIKNVWRWLSGPLHTTNGDKWFKEELNKIRSLEDLTGEIVDVEGLITCKREAIASLKKRIDIKPRTFVKLNHLRCLHAGDVVRADVFVGGGKTFPSVPLFDGERWLSNADSIPDEQIRAAVKKIVARHNFRIQAEKLFARGGPYIGASFKVRVKIANR
jgi:RNA polymerase sigma factor (sigma-70 family)